MLSYSSTKYVAKNGEYNTRELNLQIYLFKQDQDNQGLEKNWIQMWPLTKEIQELTKNNIPQMEGLLVR